MENKKAQLKDALEFYLTALDYHSKELISKESLDSYKKECDQALEDYSQDPSLDAAYLKEAKNTIDNETEKSFSEPNYEHSRDQLIAALDNLVQAEKTLQQSAKHCDQGLSHPRHKNSELTGNIKQLAHAVTAFKGAIKENKKALEILIKHHGKESHTENDLIKETRNSSLQSAQSLLKEEGKKIDTSKNTNKAEAKSDFTNAFNALKTAKHYLALAKDNFNQVKKKGHWSISKTYKTAKAQLKDAEKKVAGSENTLERTKDTLETLGIDASSHERSLQTPTPNESIEANAAETPNTDNALLFEYQDDYDEYITAKTNHQDSIDQVKSGKQLYAELGTTDYTDNRRELEKGLRELRNTLNSKEKKLNTTVREIKKRGLLPKANANTEEEYRAIEDEVRDESIKLVSAIKDIAKYKEKALTLAEDLNLATTGSSEPTADSLQEKKGLLKQCLGELKKSQHSEKEIRGEFNKGNVRLKAMRSYKQSKSRLSWRNPPKKSASDSRLVMKKWAKKGAPRGTHSASEPLLSRSKNDDGIRISPKL